METERFDSLEQAILSVLKPEHEYIIIKHVLSQGEEIRQHYHPGATEYFLLDKGAVKFFLDKKELDLNCKDGKTQLVVIPPNVTHALVTKSDIRYLVIRDRKTETVYI